MKSAIRKAVATGGVVSLGLAGMFFIVLASLTPVDAVWRLTATAIISCVTGSLIGLIRLWGWRDAMDERNRWTVEEDRR